MCSSDKEMENLYLHAPHMHYLATKSGPKCRMLLESASPKFVDALATAVKVIGKGGVKFDPYHERRARRLMSKNVAKRTKKALVSGKQAGKSRGGKFFKDVAKTVMEMEPDMMHFVVV